MTSLDAKIDLFEYKFINKCVVVIGNESNGVDKKVQAMADVKIKIPMIGETESLNASVAASIVAYEVLRKNK